MKRHGLIFAFAFILWLAGRPAYAQTRVALSMYGLDTARSVAIASDIIEHAEAQGFMIETRNANRKLSTQIEDISELLRGDPQYLVISAVKAVGLRDIISDAAAQGVKVLMVDRLSADANPGDILSNIGIDCEWAGGECARLLAEYFDGKPGRILEIQGERGAWSTNGFAKGFRDVLCSYENLQIAGVIRCEFDRVTAKEALIDYCERHGQDTFDAVFGHSDEEGLGAVNALFLMGSAQEIPIISIGGQNDAIRALDAGFLYACVEVTPYFGQAVVAAIQSDLLGEETALNQLSRGQARRAPNPGGSRGY